MRLSIGIFLLITFIGLNADSVLAQSDSLFKSIKLSRVEKKTLNESVPSSVRSFLETAEEFEVFAQLKVRDGKLQAAMDETFVPNFSAVVTDAKTRSSLLKALYTESSKGEPPAVCYLPSHSIVAKKDDQRVTVEICFGCNRFSISGALGKSDGTFSRSSGATERLITRLIEDLGVTTK